MTRNPKPTRIPEPPTSVPYRASFRYRCGARVRRETDKDKEDKEDLSMKICPRWRPRAPAACCLAMEEQEEESRIEDLKWSMRLALVMARAWRKLLRRKLLLAGSLPAACTHSSNTGQRFGFLLRGQPH